jgi:hypothetical protein
VALFEHVKQAWCNEEQAAEILMREADVSVKLFMEPCVLSGIRQLNTKVEGLGEADYSSILNETSLSVFVIS